MRKIPRPRPRRLSNGEVREEDNSGIRGERKGTDSVDGKLTVRSEFVRCRKGHRIEASSAMGATNAIEEITESIRTICAENLSW